MQPLDHQVRTARTSGLLFLDLPRGVLSVSGKDRADFLHRLLSNDIKGLSGGQAKPACLLDRQGKIQFSCNAHLRPDEILLEMDPASLPAARAGLQRYVVADAVRFEEAGRRFRVLSAHGPAVARLKPAVPTGGFEARHTLLGMPGLDLWLASSDAGAASAFTRLCTDAGIADGEPEAFQILRVEAGLPLPGREITPEVIVSELGREEFVSDTKGCYVGQEIVARIKHRAHPPRLLTGFFLEADSPPAGGHLLHEGKSVGILTSACFSPTLRRCIGLGFLAYGCEAKAFQLEGSCRAERAELPFVPPSTSSG